MSAKIDISEAYARKLDKADPLAGFRSRFYIPESTIYVDGNSLGLMSVDAEESLLRVVNEWKTQAINGWLQGGIPWFYLAERMGEQAAKIVGAKPSEMIMTGGTTINIHSLISSFFQPKGERTKILADELNFPSDIYALQGQLKMHQLDPNDHLVLIPSRDGLTISEEDIVRQMTDEIAVVFLPSVLYKSGQLLDMDYLTDQAHKRGILIGFDCSHSAGTIPHYFDDWGVDFATFCSYKYMNGGPGAPAFLYLNEKHFDREPKLAGWFGYKKNKQFDLLVDFENEKSAGGWQISTPGILGIAPIEGALNITLEAGIEQIREKSQKLTGYFIDLMEEILCKDPYNFNIATPKDPEKRSGHVSISHETEALRINEALKERNVVPDFRPPNNIRIAPVALYNTYYEVWQLVQFLKEIIDTKEYKKFSKDRQAVS